MYGGSELCQPLDHPVSDIRQRSIPIINRIRTDNAKVKKKEKKDKK